MTVLDRSGRQASLTAAGRLLAGYAERLATLLRDAERDLAALTGLRRGDLDLVLTEYDGEPPEYPSLEPHELAFDPYRLVVPNEWRVDGLGDLDGRTWVAGPPDTACDHALRRLVPDAAIGDVCVEFPSVLALVGAGRGAAVVPASTLAGQPVTVCPVPDLGGRRIAALCRRGPSPAVATVLAALRRSPSGTSARPTTRSGS